MHDALSHPAWHASTRGFARTLARRLELRPIEVPWPDYKVDAALAVAPARLKAHRAPAMPVVVLNGRSAEGAPLGAASVVCGVHDDDDAGCAAVAGALADALDLRLVLVHATPYRGPATPALCALSGMPLPVAVGDPDDLATGREIVDRIATEAGLGHPGSAQIGVVRGAPGPAIVAAARRERAALVVVSSWRRGRLRRALRHSTTGYLIRRCERPVVVCPRDPAAAMRLREALAPESDGRTQADRTGG